MILVLPLSLRLNAVASAPPPQSGTGPENWYLTRRGVRLSSFASLIPTVRVSLPVPCLVVPRLLLHLSSPAATDQTRPPFSLEWNLSFGPTPQIFVRARSGQSMDERNHLTDELRR